MRRSCGAGSGKTRTITYRVAYLIESGVSPSEILLLTFTNKAAREMIDRVSGLLGGMPPGLWAGTFHSIAARVLRSQARLIGRTPNFTILDAEDARDLLKWSLKDLLPAGRKVPTPAVVWSMISYARNACVPLPDVVFRKYPNHTDLTSIFQRAAEVYEQRKRAADALDFDDLLIGWREVLMQHANATEKMLTPGVKGPQPPGLAFFPFRYVLVDEYQDTNTVQAGIVDALAREYRNLLVVGDDAQSIYSFRAADVRNILSFPDKYPDAKIFRLLTNYRSTPNILHLANASIAGNRDQFKKELSAVREEAEDPLLVPANHPGQEAHYIAEQILSLQKEGAALATMAVLFRAAFHAQPLEFELMKRGIPYEYRGGMKFFERAHIKDVLSHIRLFVNPLDEPAWMRVLGLAPGLGAVTAARVVETIRPLGALTDILLSDPQLSPRAKNGWNQVRSFLAPLTEAGKTPAEMIRGVVAAGYRTYLEGAYPDAKDRLDDLEQLALFAESYESVAELLTDFSLSEEFGARGRREEGGGGREEGGGRVSGGAGSGSAGESDWLVLSTIHQAKGLEWDTVFVMHLVDGKFPSERSMAEEGGMEEERRLFYVAVTRARHRLYLTYPIMGSGEHMSLQARSPFIDELPADTYEQLRLVARPTTVLRPSIDDWADDPVLEVDDLGERKEPARRGFLRSIDEL
ncbi:ATP-dependent helicase [Candidatus Uhrbacteria bacterium]|nr:ATP-dependent helicase [Candidatus Uhrbacteria bacterium]